MSNMNSPAVSQPLPPTKRTVPQGAEELLPLQALDFGLNGRLVHKVQRGEAAIHGNLQLLNSSGGVPIVQVIAAEEPQAVDLVRLFLMGRLCRTLSASPIVLSAAC